MSVDKFMAETRPSGFDDKVDIHIGECLEAKNKRSFITFAGAGSGKTYSLKKALDRLNEQYGEYFIRTGKKVAVVTFTNNAADEIKERIEQSPIFAVSTIHSFCWNAIKGFNEDIRKWYLAKIPEDLLELNDLEKRGRAGKASDARKRAIVRLSSKLDWLADYQEFIYDPNGVNSSQNSLSHADVLKMFSQFIINKPMMAEIAVGKFPFVFIDESQDTNKDVVGAFLALAEGKSEDLVVGLFGDSMQRIFGGGDPQLGKSKPPKWVEFDKQMNHRSGRRIVGLGNQIRWEGDKRSQFARDGAGEGLIRYFLLPLGTPNKGHVEAEIREVMREVTKDDGWIDVSSKQTVILLLEHEMAGRRLGFDSLWSALKKSSRIKDHISDGSNSELNFFSKLVLPLAEASLAARGAEVMSILRSAKSPLLEEIVFEANKSDPLLPARIAEQAFNEVISRDGVTIGDALEVLGKTKLLSIPVKLNSFVKLSAELDVALDDLVENSGGSNEAPDGVAQDTDVDDDEIAAWAGALDTNFWQLRRYQDYTDQNTIFRTHQGVKGNEFERVMVIMDDNEAGGFLYSYEQYFGAKDASRESQKKMAGGEETGFDRTSRLFYVTSTRAKNSLVHVIYTSSIEKVRHSLISRKFAQEHEVIDFSQHVEEIQSLENL